MTIEMNWIPVTERLPEKEGEYLLYGKVCEDDDNDTFIGFFDEGSESFGIWKEEFDRITLGCLGADFYEYASVVAWMPLPLPWKGE